jgi:hypothetical protein
MVMNFTQVHLSVMECYKYWFFFQQIFSFFDKEFGKTNKPEGQSEPIATSILSIGSM